MSKDVLIEYNASTPVEYTRKRWFLCVKSILKLFIKKPEFIFLGKPTSPGCIVLSNHEAASVPLALELYGNLPIRFWGTHEMREGFTSGYRYMTRIYYHQKKHWNLWLARLFCLIATPLTKLFYAGLDLIPTYSDIRLKKTLKLSVNALKKGHTLVIFPEDSNQGYLKELTQFHQGAVTFLKYCHRCNLDVPVYVAYYNRDKKQYIFDKPTSVDRLLGLGLSRAELAEMLCTRCNELGKMEL